MEYPIDDAITLDDIVKTYEVLVHSGAPIAEINAIRKHLSAIKGGRLARAAAPAQQVSIMVSDVPDKALDSLSSGLTMPDSTTAEDCYRIAERHGMVKEFPPAVRELFSQTHPGGDAEVGRRRPSPGRAGGRCCPIPRCCRRRRPRRRRTDSPWKWTTPATIGITPRRPIICSNRLRKLRQGVSRACIVSGGEVTVKVKAKHGAGGRNSHFALYCAEKIAGENITVLSAGTDGIDGNSPAAGAVADGTTLQRAKTLGLNASKALAGFDAFPFFERLGRRDCHRADGQ